MLKRKLDEEQQSRLNAAAAGTIVPRVPPEARCGGGGGGGDSSSTLSGSSREALTALIVYQQAEGPDEEAEPEPEPESRYACGKCARTFSTPGWQRRHENQCTYIPTYTCERCGREGFRSLAGHRRYCTGVVQEEQQEEEQQEEDQEEEQEEEDVKPAILGTRPVRKVGVKAPMDRGDDGDGGRSEDGDGAHVDAIRSWEKLELRCCVTWKPLRDPAKLISCNHAAQVNFDALETAGNTCPVYGCQAANRARLRMRDDKLRTKLRRLPEGTEAVYINEKGHLTSKMPGTTKRPRQG